MLGDVRITSGYSLAVSAILPTFTIKIFSFATAFDSEEITENHPHVPLTSMPTTPM